MIGIDLDGVTLDFYTPFCAFIKQKSKNKYSPEPADFCNDPDFDRRYFGPNGTSIVNEYVKQFGEEGQFQKLDFMPHARRVIEKLGSTVGVVFLTSRTPTQAVIYDTLWLLDRYDLNYTVEFGEKKFRIAQEYKITHFIEDRMKYIQMFRNGANEIKLMMFNQFPPRRVPKGCLAVSSWNEIYEIIKKDLHL
jgi:hypothetical protein